MSLLRVGSFGKSCMILWAEVPIALVLPPIPGEKELDPSVCKLLTHTQIYIYINKLVFYEGINYYSMK